MATRKHMLVHAPGKKEEKKRNKRSRFVSICTYACKKHCDGFLLMFIALGLSKAVRFQERFESVSLASIPRANSATGKGRLAKNNHFYYLQHIYWWLR